MDEGVEGITSWGRAAGCRRRWDALVVALIHGGSLLRRGVGVFFGGAAIVAAIVASSGILVGVVDICVSTGS